jgi:hypothetical protein
MWGVYYGTYIVTSNKLFEQEKEKYYKEQEKLFKEGKIEKITSFKSHKCNFF